MGGVWKHFGSTANASIAMKKREGEHWLRWLTILEMQLDSGSGYLQLQLKSLRKTNIGRWKIKYLLSRKRNKYEVK